MQNKDTLPDYKLAAQELDALFAAQGFAQPQIFAKGKRKDESGWEHNRFEVHINGEVFTWRAGLAIKGELNPAEVLARYCAEGVDAETTFPDWCANFGYEEDSRKALATYLECQANGIKARKVLGSRKLVEQFAELSNRL